MAKREKKSLGEGLVEQGLITQAQLKEAQAKVAASGQPLRRCLIKMGLITEEDMVAFLSEQLSIPHIDLSNYLIDPKIIDLVPEELARRYQLVPILKIGDSLTCAMVDPLNVRALDAVRLKIGLTIEPAVATEERIKKALDEHYGAKGTMEDVIKAIDKEKLGIKEGEEIELKRLQGIVEEPPVIKLVNLMIMDAIRKGASDVHIEPDEEKLRTRFRVDGILYEVSSPPKHLQSAIISRIKILSEMDIAERRIPQDGRFQMRMENREIDIRVSCVPTIYGENVVMRLLDVTTALLGLKELGFSPKNLEKYDMLIRRPYGIILVAGPTGCGKTTTLYASLNTINTVEKNIITIEDPVEYRLKLIRQIQVNPKVKLTFANGLRSILRQDPDVIMVGEIRDRETAEIAIHAALTGHLVFSTLHTNDAPGALTRLIDMGVEPFLVASSIIGVIAQRLVRIICPDCKEPYQPSPEMLKELGLRATSNQRPKGVPSDSEGKPITRFYRGKGCKKCMDTGYKGRAAIFELMVPNEEIHKLTVGKTSTEEIRKAAAKAGMRNMRQDGLGKVIQGVTAVEEVLRVTQEE